MFSGHPCYSTASMGVWGGGVEAGVKLLPKQMKKVALFVYPGLRMMVATQ